MIRRFRVQIEPELIEKPAQPVIPNDGSWIPACGGTETPFFTRTGRRLLYCWNPVSGQHAYIDVQTDLILSDEEARLALQTY